MLKGRNMGVLSTIIAATFVMNMVQPTIAEAGWFDNIGDNIRGRVNERLDSEKEKLKKRRRQKRRRKQKN